MNTEDRYVITDGDRFIYRNYKNTFVPISGEMCADVFTKRKAENVYNNSLSKAQRKIFYLKKVEVPKKEIVSEPEAKVTEEIELKSKKEPVGIKACDMNINTKQLENANIEKWFERLKELNTLSNDAEKRQAELNAALSEVDKELTDLDHYLESSRLNAYEMWYLGDQRKKRLEKRRQIKDELMVVTQIANTGMSNITLKITDVAEGLENRVYKPRVLTKYFQ